MITRNGETSEVAVCDGTREPTRSWLANLTFRLLWVKLLCKIFHYVRAMYIKHGYSNSESCMAFSLANQNSTRHIFFAQSLSSLHWWYLMMMALCIDSAPWDRMAFGSVLPSLPWQQVVPSSRSTSVQPRLDFYSDQKHPWHHSKESLQPLQHVAKPFGQGLLGLSVRPRCDILLQGRDDDSLSGLHSMGHMNKSDANFFEGCSSLHTARIAQKGGRWESWSIDLDRSPDTVHKI